MIFETERLLIRRLGINDLEGFHLLESNPKVLKFATGTVKSLEENKSELKKLIGKYQIVDNNFWIYAVERKIDAKFIGTIALIENNVETEIGYRFIETFWRKGYGLEVCKGLLLYCKKIGITSLIAFVIDVNSASKRIVEKLNFKVVDCFLNQELQLKETKYKILLNSK